MSKISSTGKRIAMPKLRAVTMKDRRTKRKRTRQAQRSAWQKDCN